MASNGIRALRRQTGADEWMTQVRAWASSFPQRGHVVDDDRETLNDRGDDLFFGPKERLKRDVLAAAMDDQQDARELPPLPSWGALGTIRLKTATAGTLTEDYTGDDFGGTTGFLPSVVEAARRVTGALLSFLRVR